MILLKAFWLVFAVSALMIFFYLGVFGIPVYQKNQSYHIDITLPVLTK